MNLERDSREADLIIKGGTILTMVKDAPPLEGAVIHIFRGRITRMETAPSPTPPGAEVIDATGCIVLPGLINAHAHTAMTIFRGYADDLSLKEWLFEKVFPAEAAHLSPDSVYWGALLGCLEMIASGTTCFADGYFFQDATMRAVQEAGLRALVAQGVIDFPAPGVPDPAHNIRTARTFMERWQGASPLLTPGLFCHSPLTCSGDTLKAGASEAKRFGVPLQIHLSETRGEVDEILHRTGMKPVPYLDQLGVLDSNLLAAHAIHLDEEERLLLAESGAAVAHVPESNMKLASGAAPVSRMLKKGIPVGLGTDGCCSNNNLDLLQELDSAAKLSKVSTGNPVSLTAYESLQMATALGARALGLDEEIGTLEPGKQADIITIDTGSPHLCPLYDPYSALVYAASGADVRDTVVGGRVLMRNRSFQTLDAGAIMKRVNKIAFGIQGHSA